MNNTKFNKSFKNEYFVRITLFYIYLLKNKVCTKEKKKLKVAFILNTRMYKLHTYIDVSVVDNVYVICQPT